MQKTENKTSYFFVDESGDPQFYDRYGNLIVGNPGCSKFLTLGFIETEAPDELRSGLESVRAEISVDKYLAKIPSIQKSLMSFHAKDDCPEVREKVFKKITELPFKTQFIVARKIESVFRKKHKANPNGFYDDLIAKLFENRLHKSAVNKVYFAVRGNRARQAPLERAIQNAVRTFEKKWSTQIEVVIEILPQSPEGEPCLQIIDYMNWSVYRAFDRGEMRFFDYVSDKVSLLVDLYDFNKYPNTYYNRSNKFNVNKISPL